MCCRLNILPDDYLSFLRIHGSFSKYLDIGLIPGEKISDFTKEMRNNIYNSNSLGYHCLSVLYDISHAI